ncbi:MAG: 4-hydroxy-3-methylbut-2-enyl diphosphate reductase [Lachnospiraceae bacterium]|nr:4-hydroxy-3-methylbut-2-enyl diphosphate reductase [Lachnospiraceae bacterium]
MEVVVAKSAGFCFGVKRAVDAVYEQLETGKTIHTYGPIVHNEEVVKALEERGVKVIEDEEELRCMECETLRPEEGTIIIRAHGVPRKTYELIHEKGFECIDATCPFVKRIHRLINGKSAKGRHIIIIGSEQHPEVIGIKGWASGPVSVIETKEQAEDFSTKNNEKLFIVSQTTFNYKKFQDLVEIFQKKGYDIIVADTICNATEERQREALELAARADVMIVIGGTHSSNTRKLYELCKSGCENTYYIRTLEDLQLELPNSVELVGITAGASTPNKIIEEVQNYVRINF